MKIPRHYAHFTDNFWSSVKVVTSTDHEEKMKQAMRIIKKLRKEKKAWKAVAYVLEAKIKMQKLLL